MSTESIARQFLRTSVAFSAGAWVRCIDEWEREERTGPIADAVTALRKAFWHDGTPEQIAAFWKAHAELKAILEETQPRDGWDRRR